MRILAIDPGPEESGWVEYDSDFKQILESGIWNNDDTISALRVQWQSAKYPQNPEVLVVEWIESFGMAVGVNIFKTVFWIGRFCEAWLSWNKAPYRLIPRRKIKMHFCGNVRAKDTNIRQVLIDRFGPGKERAIGKKKTPGPLYGVKKDIWSALALAVYWAENDKSGKK